MRLLPILALWLYAASCSASTWYVNASGGNRYSVNVTSGVCDGTTADAPVGSTPNQHCAFNDIRYLWTDASYNTDPGAGAPHWGWIGSGGDTYLIDCSGMAGGACRIGQSGPGSGDGFGLFGSPFASGAPSPISGISGAHTKIYGINHGACSDQSARTHIFGGYAAGYVISMAGVSYVDFECFDITDHSNCGRQGQTSTCSTSYPLTDFATDGIAWANSSTHDTLTDVRIHGLARAGMFGPTGTGVVMTDIAIIGNASSGWNADNGSTGTGTVLIQNFNISWNGCAEEYPIVDAVPYGDCTDDSGGGYGDGFGTATIASSPGWQAHFDNGVVSYNTQDGLDALHLIGTGSSMTITRVLAYGNMGQQIKVGGASGTAINNVLTTNCNALRQAIPGTPPAYGTYTITGYSSTQPGGTGTPTTYVFSTTTQSPLILTNQHVFLSSITGPVANFSLQAVVVSAVTSTSFTFTLGTAAPISFTSQTGTGFIGYNSGLSDYCRASDTGIEMTVGKNSTLTFDDNTIYAANATAIEIDCDTYAGSCDSTSLIDFRNNVFLGFINGPASGYPGATTGDYSNPIFTGSFDPFPSPGSVYSHNLTYHAKSSWPCPNTGEGEVSALCVDPQLVDETWHLYGYGNVAVTSPSPGIAAGTNPRSPSTTDFLNITRASPQTMGACETVGPLCPGVGVISGETGFNVIMGGSSVIQ